MRSKNRAMISVIVPIYNAEPWLEDCIKSICKQSYRNLEIILVDDGSKDNSLAICQEFAGRDHRIRVISKSNSGVSDSRNIGMQYSSGEYITFVDADDFLSLDILEKAVQLMESDSSQLCAWNLACLLEGVAKAEPHINGGLVSCETAVTAIIDSNCSDLYLGRYFRASWAKLYCATVIRDNNIIFSTKLHIGEDAIFLLEYLKHIEYVTVFDTIGYYYRIQNNSAVRRFRPDLFNQNKLQMNAIMDYLNNSYVDCGANIDTALVCFAWGIFRRLIRNQLVGEKQHRSMIRATTEDAQMWYRIYSSILRRRGLNWKLMPKTTKLQYVLSYYLPVRLQCMIAAVLEYRKILK